MSTQATTSNPAYDRIKQDISGNDIVLYMKGTDRKVIFQGVHQLMGSDLGPKWAPGEKKTSKMVFIGLDLPRDVFLQGLEGCLA